jgi:hypothetical protein
MMKKLLFEKVMKKILALMALIFLGGTLWAQTTDSVQQQPGPRFSFEHSSHDYGNLYQGEQAEHVFIFTNAGDAPLVLNNVLTTCGCTAPEWTKGPVAPGEQGEVKIVFDTAGKIGRQNKVITLRSNAVQQDQRLKISAMVLPKKKD